VFRKWRLFFLKVLLVGLISLCPVGETLAQISRSQNGLAQRIAHTDPSKYQISPRVHGGAGSLAYMELFGPSDFNTNVIFVHRGVLLPRSGIGHHFHNQMEEMFVIFDNRAQFTVDGRTAELIGPAAAPCRMGSSHGIYNPSDQPTQWMNIAVGSVRGRYDAFDLSDDRVEVLLDPKPVFINIKMDKSLLKGIASMNGGKGTVSYRRMLGPEVFRSNWGYVDHLVIPPGSTVGAHRHETLEEIYYVLSGKGQATVGDETVEVEPDNAVPCHVGEAHGFSNPSQSDLEFLIIGVALEKGKFDEKNLGPEVPKP
jgi:mannose-6-phosphate isomerase-like protein (cupin superfamily)